MPGVLVACLLVGHSSGETGRRHRILWLAADVIFALVLYVVLDFDRPQRRLIRVDQTPLIGVGASLGVTPTPPPSR